MFAVNRAPEGTFDDAVRRTHAAGMSSYAHSRYDNGKFRAMVDEATTRGDAPDLSYFFNNVRTDVPDWSLLQHNASPSRLRRLAAEEEPAVVDKWANQNSTMFFHLHPADLDCMLILIGDDDIIPPETAAEVLRQMRNIMVESAT
jgi:hypothetical protein